MGEASEAYNLLDAHLKATGDDTSLLAITKDYLTRYRERHQSISLDALFSEYWESKEHLSKIHRKQILYAKHRFNQLQEVLDDLSAGTQNRYIRLLKSMWAFAVRKGYSKESPAANLDFSHLPKKGTDPISPNLEAWLKAYLQQTETHGNSRVLKLPPGTLRKARKRIFSGPRIPAGLRHCYASAMINSGKR